MNRAMARWSSRTAGIPGLGVVLALVTALTVTMLVVAELRTSASLDPSRGTDGGTSVSHVMIPNGWRVIVAYGLVMAIPGGWSDPVDINQNHDPAGPERWIVVRQGDEIAVTMTTWPGTVAAVVDTHVVRGNLQPLRVTNVPGLRSAKEVTIGGLRWRDPNANTAGKYEARHLFVQASNDLVVDLWTTSRWVPDETTSVSATVRETQDAIAASIVVAHDSNRTVTRSDVQRVLAGLGSPAEASANALDALRGEQLSYSASAGARIDVTVFTTREERLAAERSAATIASATRTVRGLANVLVVVEAPDPTQRYALAIALDRLTAN